MIRLTVDSQSNNKVKRKCNDNFIALSENDCKQTQSKLMLNQNRGLKGTLKQRLSFTRMSPNKTL